MNNKTKIEIEIGTKKLKQLKILSEYMNQPVESIIDKILTKELKYYTCDNFQHLEEFANDILFFDNLISDLKVICDKNK